MKKALPLSPDKTKWFLLNPEQFDINKLEANEMQQEDGKVIAKIPKMEGRIRDVWDEGHRNRSIRLVIGRETDRETGEIREETVKIGEDISGMLPGMMFASGAYHEYFDVFGNLINDPLPASAVPEPVSGTQAASEPALPRRSSTEDLLKKRVAEELKEQNKVQLGNITLVRIPDIQGRIRILPPNKQGISLVEYKHDQWYDPVKKQSRNRKVLIGQVSGEYPGAMIPNDRYYHHFDITTGELWYQDNEEKIREALQEIRENARIMQEKREEEERRKEEEERQRKLYGENAPELREAALNRLNEMISASFDKDEEMYNQEMLEAYGESGVSPEPEPAGETDESPDNKEESAPKDDGEDDLQRLYSQVSAERERTAVLTRILEAVTKSISARAKKRPDDLINTYKARKINAILTEIRAKYRGSGYEDLLELIREPEETEEDGRTILTGMTYSDAEVLLSHYATITEHIRLENK